jgi:hypothetical protein
MDDPEDVADEGGQWEHPSPTPEIPAADDVDETDTPAVTSSAIDTEPTGEMPDPPTLPDALFADDADASERQVWWYVREDAAVLVLANRELDREHYHAVATSPLVETGDGGYEWEIPAALIRGRSEAADVPEVALIDPGRSIHFRASPAMLDGPVRTCYAMTTDRLEELTG